MLAIPFTLLVFLLFIGGASLPLAARLRGFAPIERLALGVGGALVGLYLASLTVYLTGADWRWLWLWPLASAALVWPARHELKVLLADPVVQSTLFGWGSLMLWCLGLQALVFFYSGGMWAVDWFEHYERALFFELHWPADHSFVAGYLLPARPPFANLVVSGFLALTGHGFAEYQITATLLSTLVFLPLAALTQMRGPSVRAVNLLVVLLMLSPLFAQNTTFPWTKLPAAYFVILGVVMITSRTAGQLRHTLAAVALSAALLTHYSAGPWILALFGGWVAAGGWQRLDATGQRAVFRGLLWGGVLAVTWFGWAALEYGPARLASATSTFGHAPDVDWVRRLTIAALNVRYSLIPDLDSPTGALLLRQPDLLGRLRDLAFIHYQVNLPLAFGVGNLAALAWLCSRQPAGPERRFWVVTTVLAVVTGIAVHSRLDHLGLAHISLQPLVLMGLAWIARRADDLPRGLRILWLGGLAVDCLLGIALHFGLQSLVLLRWLHPGIPSPQLIRWLSDVAVANFENKYRAQQPFLADLTGAGQPLIIAGLITLLAVALWRCRRHRTDPHTHA